MLPAFSISGVLPPHMGDPRDPSQVSPYRVTTSELVSRYCITGARIDILSGLLKYRELIHSMGINSGFQLLDGSFTENIEATELRVPKDIDLVTFAHRPMHLNQTTAWLPFIDANPGIFDSEEAKKLYRCDAYYVDLNISPLLIVDQTIYWNGLFSHRRDGLWKGMIRIELGTDDTDARTRLTGSAPL